ncbi:hypoxia-inducible factor 1-alpha-like isoform X1 [Genypterus blacodes]|uniref:hypoxia-inducible factor 1-alpha-like isoform X1 n=1 Tax=Genypterus blacodes TaxID=154954 RepID=UPI003F75A0EB
MDAPDPAATIAKRLSQLNKEASLRTLAAQNLQRKRKLSEILGQGALLNDQQEQKKILKVSESAAPAAVSHGPMLLLPTDWASRLLGSTSESSSLFTLPHLTLAPLQGRQYLLLGEELLLLWTMLTVSMLSLLTAGPDWTLQFLPNVLSPSLRPRPLLMYLYESDLSLAAACALHVISAAFHSSVLGFGAKDSFFQQVTTESGAADNNVF